MSTIKHILQLSLGLFLIIGMVSCSLDENNPGGASADDIWSTEKGFQTLVNSCYINQRAFYGVEDGIIMSEAGTDLWFRASKASSYIQLFKYQSFTSSSAGTNTNYWRDIWPGINYCNTGIGRINNIKWSSETTKKQKAGEMHFLRAFYYYHVVETWGGVMLRTSETTSSSDLFNDKRSSVSDFYDLMISDLDSAINWLPSSPVISSEYSRATRKSAMGLLARVLLTRGYYSIDNGNVTDAQSYFTRAKEVAHAVIDSSAKWGVSLITNYPDLWDNSATGNNKKCKESLYTISNSTNPSLNYSTTGNRLHLWFLAKYSDKPGMQMDIANGHDGYRYFMPTEFLLDLFNEKLDARYSGSFQDTWYCNNSKGYTWVDSDIKRYGKNASVLGQTLAKGDTALYITKKQITDKSSRKYVVIDRDSLFRADSIYTTADVWVALKKYIDPTRTSTSTQAGTRDIIVIRLAEMYLIAAEAEFQLNDNGSAATDINVIRNRASKTHSGDLDIAAGDVTLDFILDERAREFAGEHMRWFDLKRTRTLARRIDAYNKNIAIPSALREKSNGVFENVLLRPIPQTQIDALSNGAAFGQNPGY